MARCPTLERLRQFLSFSHDDHTEIADHVDTCRDCQSTLERLNYDDVSDRPHATSGETIPGYEILSELGRGGMGVVYLARQTNKQTKLHRFVALKMILAGAHASPALRARFRIEADAVARLQHPNIVQIFRIDEHNHLPYLELEYCPGGNLKAKLGRTALSPEDAAKLVQKLAIAVQKAHHEGVVHRDLKPENVLLLEDGFDSPKISDFGLAKIRDDRPSLTRSEQTFGTPNYMAPEQVEGKHSEIGPTTDVYALGAILYELLTGQPPFDGGSPAKTLALVSKGELTAPTQIRSNIPRDVEAICITCLEKDQSRRYPTAQALSEDLGRFLHHESVLARPRNWVSRLGRTVVLRQLDTKFRHWDRTAFAFAALLGVASAEIFLFVEMNFSERGRIFSRILFLPGVVLLLIRCARSASELERQLAWILIVNFFACGFLNWVRFGSMLAPWGTNEWAHHAIVNASSLAICGIFVSRWLHLAAIGFLALGIWMSRMPFHWSCLTYGVAWALTLVIVGFYFRRAGRGNESAVRL
jgi:serine/threonine protein kinase